MENLPIKQIIEGAILASERPLNLEQIMQLFGDEVPDRSEVRAVLKEIGADCVERSYELKLVASGYRFQIKSEYGEWVSRLWKEKPPRYSRALLETLALIAYKQPITRGDIEEIRGVAVSTNIMRTLIEREWVKVVGHRDVPGQPALYVTTKSFLDYFNLRSLDELPSLSDIRDLASGIEELGTDDDLIGIRTLDIDDSEQGEVANIEDTDLDKVSERVTNIQENIRTLFAPELDARKERLEQKPATDSDINQTLSAREQFERLKTLDEIPPEVKPKKLPEPKENSED